MEYKLRKSADQCARCETAFELGAPLVSAILLGEQEPQRLDFCPACFETERGDRPADDVFAHWKTRKHELRETRRTVDFAALQGLFFRMARQHGPEYRKLSYLMALILIRKRFIQLKEFVTQGGTDYLVIASKSHPEPLTVEAPELAAHEFDELRDRLRFLLDIDPEQDLDVATASSAARETGATP